MRRTVSLLSCLKARFLSLTLLSLLTTNVQAQDKGVADYEKGMKLYTTNPDRALPWFKKPAMDGNADGMFILGEMNANSHSEYSHDYASAVKWYRASAALGNTAAMNRLGLLYKNGVVGFINEGDGSPKAQDAELARRWFQKAAQLGDSNGIYNIAQLYGDDNVLPHDFDKWVHWQEKAAALDNTKSMVALGVYLLSNKNADDEEQGMQWLKRAADIGKTGAMIKVGDLYLEGTGAEKNPAQALKWYKKAIANGAAAQGTYKISALYDSGRGAPQTEALKRYWRKRAWTKFTKPWQKKRQQEFRLYQAQADDGNAQAMYNLGDRYHEGTGVAEDKKLSIYWYRKAASMGGVEAMYQAGLAYDRGDGVKRDYSQAMSYYQQAAISGHVGAMYFIGDLYNEGHGVKQNRDIAIIWWKRAAQNGNIPACFQMRFVKKMENKNAE